MHRTTANTKKGFTLIELIVAIAILGIALPIISSVFIYSLDQTRDEDSKLTTMTDVQTIVQKIKAESKYGLDKLYSSYHQGSDNTMVINVKYDDVNSLFNRQLAADGTLSGMYGCLNFKQPLDQDSNDIAMFNEYASYRNGNVINIPDLGSRYNCTITILCLNSNFYNSYKLSVIVADTKNQNKTSSGFAFIGGE